MSHIPEVQDFRLPQQRNGLFQAIGIVDVFQPLAVVVDGIADLLEQRLILLRLEPFEVPTVSVLRTVFLDVLLNIQGWIPERVAIVAQAIESPTDAKRQDHGVEGIQPPGRQGGGATNAPPHRLAAQRRT
eukprot:gnl/TRDRNA2_/TRDRNA2_224179_c0_seq1.p2 gnl/TRDRNA2_/TRDRNA2_224179_c0~~gnl/TRDRNA2_/TRDRNA2_224179_c0_seq1.p2  ORF type:complete len:130 (+),score=4.69 gnl/TRDRNA2_/TRDRNA2_224179_c0_seq1:116-505(+)